MTRFMVRRLTLSVVAGWMLGMAAVRTQPPRVARWMTIFSTVGLATPSFYLGALFIVAMSAYVIARGPGRMHVAIREGYLYALEDGQK